MKDKLAERIQEAFHGVKLGNGVGLLQAMAKDNREDELEQLREREKDEKENWQAISHQMIADYQSCLSFFDAEGMRFHLPAFILAELCSEVNDFVVISLSSGDLPEMFSMLSSAQSATIIEFLEWCLNEEEYDFYHNDISWALRTFWKEI